MEGTSLSDRWAFGRPHRHWIRRRRGSIFASMTVAIMLVAATAIASDVDVSVVDVTAPTGSVSLAPGASGSITINMSVTGNQAGTATFEVHRNWSLSGGVFTGSNPQEFTVAPRAAADPPTTFSTTGTVSVAAGQATGTFTLAVGAFDITNTNATGAKLAAGDSSTYQVTVTSPPPSDTTPPVITPSVTGTLGNNGWYTSDVVVAWTVVDNESAISSTSGCDSTTINADTTGTTLTCSATSAGGTNSDSVTIKRDATDPTDVAFTDGGITDGASYYYGFVPTGPTTCTANDATSLLSSCDVTGGGSEVGPHSFTATATDNAGNQAAATLSYTVLAWELSGFYAPVDRPDTMNITKNGSTVPLKFEVFAGTTELTDTTIVDTFVHKTPCSVGAVGDPIEELATGATSLRYDTTAGQFIFNWKTPKTAGSCYKVTLTTDDGSSIYANFNLK
jgi:hypothetical protein